MAYEAEQSRGEEKVRLILSQIASIRARLNVLALQHGVFGVITFILCAGALIVIAAFALTPLAFLLIALGAACAATVAIVRTVRGAWRTHANDRRAASMADERASLKGRLATILAGAESERRSALWPYLVEDTLALREEFAVAKVEPRRVSRWLYAALASLAAAALVFHLTLDARSARFEARSRAAQAEASIDLGNLDIRPADSPAGKSVQIDADPATMRRLADKLRAAQRGAKRGGPMSHLMANARDVAKALQNSLTGGKATPPPTRLRLTDKDSGHRSEAAGGNRNRDGHEQARGGRSGAGKPNSPSVPGDKLAQSGKPSPPGGLPHMSGPTALDNLDGEGLSPGNASGHDVHPRPTQLAKRGASGTGGADHGSGTDPDSLFGGLDKPPLGSGTFKIPIEAGTSDDGFGNPGPAYLPPQVKVPLNTSQYPDEPFERASIPASDRVTIKRVFER